MKEFLGSSEGRGFGLPIFSHGSRGLVYGLGYSPKNGESNGQ